MRYKFFFFVKLFVLFDILLTSCIADRRDATNPLLPVSED